MLHLFMAVVLLMGARNSYRGQHGHLLTVSAAPIDSTHLSDSAELQGANATRDGDSGNLHGEEDVAGGGQDNDNSDKGTLQVEVGGDPVALDDLGPIIIYDDGTMRRIANWALLTPLEKTATQKRIVARNKKRLEKLKAGRNGIPKDDPNDNAGEEPKLLPEGVLEPPKHGGDENTWPPTEEESGVTPPRSMF